MGYEILAAVITLYGIFFTAVLKIWEFILKLEDKDIDALLDGFHEKIINEGLRSFALKKKNARLRGEDVNDLRTILNVPVKIESLRKEVTNAQWLSFGLVLASGVTAVTSVMFPSQSGSYPWLWIPAMITVYFILSFILYCRDLNSLRKEILKAKVMIQNKKVI